MNKFWMGLDLLLLGDTLATDLVEGVEESKISSRRKISSLEERVSMIKLINCWMSALKGESLRHGSRKAVAMMRFADNKPCTTAFPLQLNQPYRCFDSPRRK